MRFFTEPGALTARELRWLIALFVLTLPAVTARLYASDEVQYYSYLRSLWFDRDVSFDNEYRHFYEAGVARTDGFRETFLEPLTPTGKRENFATIGCTLLWAPFYALADVATRLLDGGNGSAPADGFSRPYIAAVAYGSAVYAFAAVILSISAARRLTGHGLGAGLSIWFGTPLLFYMYAAPPFSHACSAFAVALFVTLWLRIRDRWTTRGLIGLGAAAALMTMVREQDVFYAIGPAVDWAIATFKAPERTSPPSRERPESSVRNSVLAALAGVSTFALVYTPQLLAYWSLNGRFGPSRLVTRKMTWTAPHAFGVLASPQHGLFIWTPLAVLAVAGLLVLWLRERRGDGTTARRRVGGCLVLMFALQVYVSGSVESWTVAGAFGQRRFVGATVLLVIGLSALCRTLPAGGFRTITTVAAIVAIWWNVALMSLFGAGLMDRQRLDVRRNAYDVFVTLPRSAPGLLYRYFTERESFYRTPSGGTRQDQLPGPPPARAAGG